MKLTGIHHYSVVVSDMERAVAFYRDVLGLQEIGIPSTFPAAGARVRWFKIGDQHLHLMPVRPGNTIDPISPRHVALNIEDAVDGREYFKAKGIATREDVLIPGADRFIVSDPDGNNIEMIQWKETYQIVPI